MNEIALYRYDAAALAVSPIPRTGNYTICAPNGIPATLKRGTDFGMIRKKNGDAMTKNPTLFKSGAEKVAVAYGLCQRYTLESKLEDIEHGFFYFLVRCDLVKIVNALSTHSNAIQRFCCCRGRVRTILPLSARPPPFFRYPSPFAVKTAPSKTA